MEPLETWRVWAQLAVVGAALVVALVRPLPALRVVAACVAAMVAYGAAQDQFTARLCPEYFTVAHNPIPGVTDPTLLGLAWGFLGGWWGGLFLGLGMAAAARAGSAPPAPARDIVRALAGLFAVVGTVSAMACVGNLRHADLLGVSVGEPWATAVPPDRHRALVAVANTHFATYTTAALGGGIACAWVGRRRNQ
ncbi:hypothetical protein [Urbifossiella limnaea]|uniref:Uncharacterized protein n=1 Tax=Urbifossiella limnaea TaxID=2528023 RepID=A0A517XQ33_9BACT|nr:hypothetical protein [Urbifossiella limnaea]QDU19619.1 hypothetical protein ETAA1_15490 [Urbifossiella limnaea]